MKAAQYDRIINVEQSLLLIPLATRSPNTVATFHLAVAAEAEVGSDCVPEARGYVCRRAVATAVA